MTRTPPEDIPRWKLAAFAVIVAGVIIALAFFSFNRWREEHHFGEVLRVDTESIVISDPKLGEREIFFNADTRIRRGSRQVENVATGTSVVVVTRKDQEGRIFAELVRIVAAPWRKKAPR